MPVRQRETESKMKKNKEEAGRIQNVVRENEGRCRKIDGGRVRGGKKGESY